MSLLCLKGNPFQSLKDSRSICHYKHFLFAHSKTHLKRLQSFIKSLICLSSSTKLMLKSYKQLLHRVSEDIMVDKIIVNHHSWTLYRDQTPVWKVDSSRHPIQFLLKIASWIMNAVSIYHSAVFFRSIN